MLGFLNLLREVLGWFQMVRSEDKNDAPGHRPEARATSRAQAQPSLRPPTIALDMLFLLAFIAFLEMNPISESVISHSANLPTADKSSGTEPASPLALRPVLSDGKWLYRTSTGELMTASEVAESTRKQKLTPILIITQSSSVQTYLDAQQPLTRLGLKKVGLAVTSERGTLQ